MESSKCVSVVRGCPDLLKILPRGFADKKRRSTVANKEAANRLSIALRLSGFRRATRVVIE